MKWKIMDLQVIFHHFPNESVHSPLACLLEKEFAIDHQSIYVSLRIYVSIYISVKFTGKHGQTKTSHANARSL